MWVLISVLFYTHVHKRDAPDWLLRSHLAGNRPSIHFLLSKKLVYLCCKHGRIWIRKNWIKRRILCLWWWYFSIGSRLRTASTTYWVIRKVHASNDAKPAIIYPNTNGNKTSNITCPNAGVSNNRDPNADANIDTI